MIEKTLLPEGLPSWLAVINGCDNSDKAIIDCDNYGGAITFHLAISGEKKKKKETIAEKTRRQRVQSLL